MLKLLLFRIYRLIGAFRPGVVLAISLIFILTVIQTDPLKAQSLPGDIATVNVDNVSDAQIAQWLEKAKASGMSDAQVVQAARDRGMSAPQAQLLQDRIRGIRGKNNGNFTNGTRDTSTTTKRILNYKPDTSQDRVGYQKQGPMQPRIFGASLFRNSNSSFEPNLNLATPVNYILGPGDELRINVYGNSTVNWKLQVSPEGNINIPGAGVINVSGKSIEQATSIIKSKLSAARYHIGNGTDVKVSLGDIRSIKVILTGEIVKPGTYTLPSLATAFNALYAAGGPNDNGTFRHIEIIRNNKVIRHLDIYDFLVSGDQQDNIGLRDQDIIRVPVYTTQVTMTGEVKNPAIFEVLPNETLQDVIKFAGGFTSRAFAGRIKVSQISDDQRRITDVLQKDFNTYKPGRGDEFTVSQILDRFENRVTINGAVFRPGEYELQAGMTLSALISNAKGLREDAFMQRGVIKRLKADNTPELISFNVKDVLNNSGGIPLMREDVVTIASIFDLRDQYRVYITGAVRNAGDFAYAEGIKVADLIFLAGGFSEGASSKRVEVARRVTDSDPNSPSGEVANVFTIDVSATLLPGQGDFALKPFDIVSVHPLPGYEKQRIIKVEGEVLYPGSYILQHKSDRISDVIKRAGGLTTTADAAGSTLKRDQKGILGIDKNKTDTAAAAIAHAERLQQVKRTLNDTTSGIPQQNNYVGIDLRSILEKPGSVTDLLMNDGDIISIPKKLETVNVGGDVLYPSSVVYEDGKSFNDYVLNAGGYAEDASRRRAYIIYPNGTVKGTGKVLFFNSHPRVRPGSEIYVPKKPLHRGISFSDILGVTSGLASIGVLIIGIISLKK